MAFLSKLLARKRKYKQCAAGWRKEGSRFEGNTGEIIIITVF